MHRAAMLFLCLTAVAFPLSKSYDVVPYRNYIGLQEDGEVGVTQYYRNTLDNITRASVWVGDASDPAVFDVQIKDSVTGVVVAGGFRGHNSSPRRGSDCIAGCSLTTCASRLTASAAGRDRAR
ncbi:MAG: hypothetical protein NTX53_07420 [candidate division WOR-3 bacterium]|nr:hypothetical protein [candidate division WOR-3 bacterium]